MWTSLSAIDNCISFLYVQVIYYGMINILDSVMPGASHGPLPQVDLSQNAGNMLLQYKEL
jgi:hypothetical protein